MGAITYQKDAGFNQGLSTLSQAIGQLVHKHVQESHFKTISDTIEKEGVSPTTLQKIIAMPSGAEYLHHMAPLLAPYLKEQARGANDTNALKRVFGGQEEEGGGQEPGFGQRDRWSEGQFPTALQSIVGQQLPESPIAMAAKYRAKTNTGAPIKITPTEEKRNGTTNVPYISGVPNNPASDATSNRRGPVEQEMYQQGGHAGMGVEPPSERDRDIQNWINQAKPNARPSAGSIPVESKRIDLADLSDMQLAELGLGSQRLQKLGETAVKLRTAKEKMDFEENKPLRESISKARESIPGKKIALDRIDDALASGDINQFTDWAAEKLGIDPLKHTQAQILDSAVKEFFLSDLSIIKGGRINQLIEKNLRQALQSAGKSPAANQEISETLHAGFDILKKRVAIHDELRDQFAKQGKRLPGNAEELVSKKLDPYTDKRLDEFSDIRKEIRKGKILNNSAASMRTARRETQNTPPKEGTAWVLGPSGQIKAVPVDLIPDAVKSGGRLIEQEKN